MVAALVVSMVKWLIWQSLRAVGQYLVDIHGQHDQEELMRPQKAYSVVG